MGLYYIVAEWVRSLFKFGLWCAIQVGILAVVSLDMNSRFNLRGVFDGAVYRAQVDVLWREVCYNCMCVSTHCKVCTPTHFTRS